MLTNPHFRLLSSKPQSQKKVLRVRLACLPDFQPCHFIVRWRSIPSARIILLLQYKPHPGYTADLASATVIIILTFHTPNKSNYFGRGFLWNELAYFVIGLLKKISQEDSKVILFVDICSMDHIEEDDNDEEANDPNKRIRKE